MHIEHIIESNCMIRTEPSIKVESSCIKEVHDHGGSSSKVQNLIHMDKMVASFEGPRRDESLGIIRNSVPIGPWHTHQVVT